MSRALTRRALVQAGAAVAAMGIPITADAGIPAPDPDAALLDLIARHAEAEEEVTRLSLANDEAFCAALDAYPPQPAALLWRPDDFPRTSFGRALADRGEDGEPWRYTARAAAALANFGPLPAWAEQTGAAMSAAQAEASEVRRLEIIAAWDGYMDARRAVEDCVGYHATAEAEDAVADLVVALANEVKRARPMTLAGLRALAAWAGRQAKTGSAHDDLLTLFAETVAGFGVAA